MAEICQFCDEPLDPCEDLLYRDKPPGLHLDCAVRMVAGSVGHLTGRCSCFGGSEDDPPGLTRREAARAAARLWRQQHGIAIERD